MRRVVQYPVQYLYLHVLSATPSSTSSMKFFEQTKSGVSLAATYKQQCFSLQQRVAEMLQRMQCSYYYLRSSCIGLMTGVSLTNACLFLPRILSEIRGAKQIRNDFHIIKRSMLYLKL